MRFFLFPLPQRHFDDGFFSRYKYVPSLIKEILFPSPQPSPPPRKRRRIEEADVDSNPDNNGVELQRSLILETVKESYLLSPSVDSPESGEGRKYDICLILEKEVVVEVDPVLVADGEHPLVVVDDVVMGDVVAHQAEVVQGLAAQTETTTPEVQPTEAVSISGSGMDPKTEDVNSKTEIPSNTVEPPKDSQLPAIGATSHSTESSPHPPATTDPSHVPSTSSAPEDHPLLLPSPTIDRPAAIPDSSIAPSKENEKVPPPPHQPVQVLQRNLTESMFRFTWEGVKIVERSSDDGVETEWAIQVCNWKWAPALR